MTVKTFTSTTLSAADTNEFLANSGLVYVSTTTWTGGASSISVTNCFSSTYDNYKIIFTPTSGTVAAETVSIQFNGLTTGYYGSCFYYIYTGAATGYQNSNNNSKMHIGLTSTTSEASYIVDVFNPNLAKYTAITGNYFAYGYSGWCGGQTLSTASHTGFTLSSISSLFSGGSITVYGYRKA